MTLLDLERGRLVLPAGADVCQFVLSDGTWQKPRADKPLTLAAMFEWYFAQQTPGAKANKTLETERLHTQHFLRLLVKSRALSGLRGQDLQEGYINKRAAEGWHGKTIRPETIGKEVKTLKMVWRRARKLGLVDIDPPTDGLTFPRGREKLPFQTWEEIERNIARGGLTKAQVREQWDSLFLSRGQVGEVLEYVRAKKTRSAYVYPLMVFVAHTGIRRSEVIRSRFEDFKFEEGDRSYVVVRELKKSQTKETYRPVPLSTLLRQVMQDYFAKDHPGGAYAFSLEANRPMLPTTLHEAFKWLYRGSKWKVLRGYHVFRHSFASNMAREGIDQRTIDELMGHQTEEMRRRYRHLFPEQRAHAVRQLYG
jgi:integrase